MNNTNIKAGVIGGIAGGVVFGAIMHMMGMMPTIATLIGSESVFVGWIMHLTISIITGIIFVALLSEQLQTYTRSALYGGLYGVVWWVLGSLIIMPVALGMGVQFANAFDQTFMMSLIGHVIFGVILGTVAYRQVSQRGHPALSM